MEGNFLQPRLFAVYIFTGKEQAGSYQQENKNDKYLMR